MAIKSKNEGAFVNITEQLINAFGSCETVSLIANSNWQRSRNQHTYRPSTLLGRCNFTAVQPLSVTRAFLTGSQNVRSFSRCYSIRDI